VRRLTKSFSSSYPGLLHAKYTTNRNRGKKSRRKNKTGETTANSGYLSTTTDIEISHSYAKEEFQLIRDAVQEGAR